MTDRAPSEQQRRCRRIQGGGSHALASRCVLQAHRSTLDLAGPAGEDSRDLHVQRLCEPAPLAPGLGRSRKFSGIRKTHCNFRTQRCPNLSGTEADSETGFIEARGHQVDPTLHLDSGKARKLPGPGGTPQGKWRCRRRAGNNPVTAPDPQVIASKTQLAKSY